MKHLFLFSLILIFSFGINAQDITGTWNGELKIPTEQLKMVIHIKQSGKGLTATMDSPDQSRFGIPVSTITFDNLKLHFSISGIIVYDGELQDDTINGIFKQSGMSFPLNLKRDTARQIVMLRPQEPKKPFPYLSEDVTFENKKDNISLAGTLTLPNKEGVFTVVVLIAGSGPQDRNEEVFGHKPFLVLSDYLTRNGIAVLRYDKRGIGKSTGNYQIATTADFASDAESAVEYLKTRKEINKKEIGLIGHSEGGIIAPMVASENKSVAFIILLAGPGLNGEQLLLLQEQAIGKSSGMTDKDLKKLITENKNLYDIITKVNIEEEMKKELSNYIQSELPDSLNQDQKEQVVNQELKILASPWYVYFLKTDPATYLKEVKCPVLALNGSKDLQVPPEQNISAIKQALADGGNKKVTTEILPGLNHLFQECKTGLPNEYATIEQTFSPTALLIIKNWILKQTK
ncbi:MAG TPA: alpha/beta hydrolase [Hanamia sp.]|nr:alpha/beta hydrolase [Hanamia sp.]